MFERGRNPDTSAAVYYGLVVRCLKDTLKHNQRLFIPERGDSLGERNGYPLLWEKEVCTLVRK